MLEQTPPAARPERTPSGLGPNRSFAGGSCGEEPDAVPAGILPYLPLARTQALVAARHEVRDANELANGVPSSTFRTVEVGACERGRTCRRVLFGGARAAASRDGPRGAAAWMGWIRSHGFGD